MIACIYPELRVFPRSPLIGKGAGPSGKNKEMVRRNKFGMHAGAKPDIFQKAKMLRSKMTIPEQELWAFLKTSPLGYKFRRQHPFGLFVLDFYCHSKGLSIELDGPNHLLINQESYDRERTKFIESFNIVEIRFPNDLILDEFDNVKSRIMHLLCADTL